MKSFVIAVALLTCSSAPWGAERAGAQERSDIVWTRVSGPADAITSLQVSANARLIVATTTGQEWLSYSLMIGQPSVYNNGALSLFGANCSVLVMQGTELLAGGSNQITAWNPSTDQFSN